MRPETGHLKSPNPRLRKECHCRIAECCPVFKLVMRLPCQGNHKLGGNQNGEKIVVVPTSPEPSGFDARFGRRLLLEQIEANAPQERQVFSRMTTTHAAVIFGDGHVQGTQCSEFSIPQWARAAWRMRLASGARVEMK